VNHLVLGIKYLLPALGGILNLGGIVHNPQHCNGIGAPVAVLVLYRVDNVIPVGGLADGQHVFLCPGHDYCGIGHADHIDPYGVGPLFGFHHLDYFTGSLAGVFNRDSVLVLESLRDTFHALPCMASRIKDNLTLGLGLSNKVGLG